MATVVRFIRNVLHFLVIGSSTISALRVLELRQTQRTKIIFTCWSVDMRLKASLLVYVCTLRKIPSQIHVHLKHLSTTYHSFVLYFWSLHLGPVDVYTFGWVAVADIPLGHIYQQDTLTHACCFMSVHTIGWQTYCNICCSVHMPWGCMYYLSTVEVHQLVYALLVVGWWSDNTALIQAIRRYQRTWLQHPMRISDSSNQEISENLIVASLENNSQGHNYYRFAQNINTTTNNKQQTNHKLYMQ